MIDRFARNRCDCAVYKQRLKQNGVQLISATENLSDNPEGIITEAILEAMAEFYSAELGQKTRRGMRESALKCKSTGSQPPLGYKWDENKKLSVDEITARFQKLSLICMQMAKASRISPRLLMPKATAHAHENLLRSIHLIIC